MYLFLGSLQLLRAYIQQIPKSMYIITLIKIHDKNVPKFIIDNKL